MNALLWDLALSLLGIAASVAAFLICSHKADQPNDSPEPRMVPWRLLTFAPVVFGLLIVAHLMTLAGIETGALRGHGLGF